MSHGMYFSRAGQPITLDEWHRNFEQDRRVAYDEIRLRVPRWWWPLVATTFGLYLATLWSVFGIGQVPSVVSVPGGMLFGGMFGWWRNKLRRPLRVSTVWLGLNHQFGGGPPLIFETMVFGDRDDDWGNRYSTEAEARAGHERVVAALRAGRSLSDLD